MERCRNKLERNIYNIAVNTGLMNSKVSILLYNNHPEITVICSDKQKGNNIYRNLIIPVVKNAEYEYRTNLFICDPPFDRSEYIVDDDCIILLSNNGTVQVL